MFHFARRLQRSLWIPLVVGALTMAAASRPALAQPAPGYTNGRWAVGSTDACPSRFYRWTVGGGEARFVDQQGSVSVERVTQWLPSGFLSRAIPSGSSQSQARWEYQFLGPDAVQVNNLSGGRSFILNRCPDGIEAASNHAPAPPTQAPAQSRIGPGFDCGLARDALAGLICGSDSLAWLDLRFSQAYQALRQQAGDAGQAETRQEAIDFQSQVYANCRLPRVGFVLAPARPAAEACVAQAYQHQRNAWAGRLSAAFQEEANRPLRQHIQLQASLQTLGYIPPASQIDGVYGPTTRAAITAWQISQNLPPTATLSSSDALLLGQIALSNALGLLPAATPAQPPPIPEMSVRNRADIKADDERRLAISRAEGDKAKADADRARSEAEKAQADADRARAEADVFAARERAQAEVRRKALEQLRAEQDAHGIQP